MFPYILFPQALQSVRLVFTSQSTFEIFSAGSLSSLYDADHPSKGLSLIHSTLCQLLGPVGTLEALIMPRLVSLLFYTTSVSAFSVLRTLSVRYGRLCLKTPCRLKVADEDPIT